VNVLVTGGAGFIGSHFVLRHRSSYADDHIVVLDKLTYAADQSFLDPIASAITFVHGDIADHACVATIVRDHAIDVIVNFAAESHVDNSISDASPFIHTNIVGVQNLIEVCKEHPDVKLLHISTDEVYGDLDDGDPPYNVGDALTPSSPYAASKAAGELLIIAAIRTHGIHACISRCTNNFGPHQADEKLIPTIIRHALKAEPVPLYAKGKNKRDWLFVTDHCDALEVLLHTPWAFWDEKIHAGHIFNIAADNEKENIEVALSVLDLLGAPHDLIRFVDDRPGHDWRYAIDASAMKKLGWKPTVSFDEGLRKTVEWYRKKYGA
jgi:dTDP-glucose 4,6-dehydratase